MIDYANQATALSMNLQNSLDSLCNSNQTTPNCENFLAFQQMQEESMNLVMGMAWSVRSSSLIGNQLNVSQTVLKYLSNPDRYVPIEVLKWVINNWIRQPDPQWTLSSAFYSIIIKNWVKYNIKVIYDESLNIIQHFHYTQKALWPLPKL